MSLEDNFLVQLFSIPQHTQAKRIKSEPIENLKLEISSIDKRIHDKVTKIIPNTAETPSPTPQTATSDNLLIAEFLDVAQADCELIYLPDGKILLIDAGNRGDGDEIVAYLKGKEVFI